jgi:hypothetical protein
MEQLKKCNDILKSIIVLCESIDSILINSNDIISNDFKNISNKIKLSIQQSILNMNRDELLENITKSLFTNTNLCKKLFPKINDFSEKNIRFHVNIMLENIINNNDISFDKYINADYYKYELNKKENKNKSENINSIDKNLKCNICGNISNDNLSFQKHNWIFHPNNDFEKYWSNLYNSGSLFSRGYSMAYQDDPYY